MKEATDFEKISADILVFSISGIKDTDNKVWNVSTDS